MFLSLYECLKRHTPREWLNGHLHDKVCTIGALLILGRNTLLVPIFKGYFQFDPNILKAFNWIPVFLSRYQFYP